LGGGIGAPRRILHYYGAIKKYNQSVERTDGENMDRFNTNEDASEAEYSLEISLTVQEMEDLVAYTIDQKINIKHVIENILDEINPEIYGVKR